MAQQHQVEKLIKTIQQYEAVIYGSQDEEEKGSDQIPVDSSKTQISPSTVQHLISLYNKAIEYYSAMNDERHMEFL